MKKGTNGELIRQGKILSALNVLIRCFTENVLILKSKAWIEHGIVTFPVFRNGILK